MPPPQVAHFVSPVGKVGPVRTRAAPEPMPTHADEFNKVPKKPIDLIAEFERASRSGEGSGEAAGDSAQDPAPEAEITIQRRKRTRERSQEPERATSETRRSGPGRRRTVSRQSHAATAPGPGFRPRPVVMAINLL